MKRIAVLTSGGDAPGMNAAIRAVVRIGVGRGYDMVGVRHGYAGLIAGTFLPLGRRDVGGLVERGGTFLGTSRCDEFRGETGQQRALSRLRDHDIGRLVVIGGNGSQAGSLALSRRGLAVVGGVARAPLPKQPARRQRQLSLESGHAGRGCQIGNTSH